MRCLVGNSTAKIDRLEWPDNDENITSDARATAE